MRRYAGRDKIQLQASKIKRDETKVVKKIRTVYRRILTKKTTYSLLQNIHGEGMIKLQNCVLKDRDFKMCKTVHFHFAKNRTLLLCFEKGPPKNLDITPHSKYSNYFLMGISTS